MQLSGDVETAVSRERFIRPTVSVGLRGSVRMPKEVEALKDEDGEDGSVRISNRALTKSFWSSDQHFEFSINFSLPRSNEGYHARNPFRGDWWTQTEVGARVRVITSGDQAYPKGSDARSASAQ